jgi:hypothetical protein
VGTTEVGSGLDANIKKRLKNLTSTNALAYGTPMP